MNGFIGRLRPHEQPPFRSVPAAAAFGRCDVAFHGYLANRADLAAVLRPAGARAGDAELVALAYERWGDQLHAHLCGEYAFALFDVERASLILAHDAFGVVPLFVAERDGVLTVGTDLAAIVAATGTGELDDEYLAARLVGADDRGERTPYRHVRRLPYGRARMVRNGAAVTVTTFDPARLEPLRLPNAGAYEARFRELISAAVASALPQTGTTWCELSGGLDSSTVLSVAAGVLRHCVEAFSTVYSRSRDADETTWIDAVLETYPVASHRIDADGVPPFSTLADRFFAEPVGSLLVCAYDDARDEMLARSGVDVVLTGNVGDAVMIGDSPRPYFLADVEPSDPLRIGAVRRWSRESPEGRSFAYWYGGYVVAPHRRRWRGEPVHSLRSVPDWIDAGFAARMDLHRPERRRLNGLGFGDEYFWQRVLDGAQAASVGQHQAPHCTFRHPLLYRPLVEFMARVPSREKLRPDVDRDLQRRALRGILPERTRLRTGKQGPAQAIFSGFARSAEWFELLTARSALVERGYVDRKRWRNAVMAARAGGCSSMGAFIQSCVLEGWFAALNRAPKNDPFSAEFAAATV